ncbi:uncharacterized protein LOC107460363 [Arachis duranensis]|uniref:Uncharacterized protein LOC107460363 n=1 Tax=Arachis duranensis TaxID=130453 RepID=A0A6P4B5D0_ARADU|nr:uncharacterized protein LOC107460363 [Arachis duranensis]
MAKQLAERPTKFFPSDTVPSPKEECKVISLRIGTMINKELSMEDEKKIKDPQQEKREENLEKAHALVEIKKEKVKTYKSRIPYPQKHQKQDQEKNFSKFLEVFKKLQINIPFVEVLEQIPLYDKFIKELLSKERSLKEDENVIFTKEYSAIIQRNLPQKLKDPGSFQIPCTIGDITIGKGLCDLGASINLMSLFMVKRLRIEEVKLTRSSL